jgi:hypothetical protein
MNASFADARDSRFHFTIEPSWQPSFSLLPLARPAAHCSGRSAQLSGGLVGDVINGEGSSTVGHSGHYCGHLNRSTQHRR